MSLLVLCFATKPLKDPKPYKETELTKGHYAHLGRRGCVGIGHLQTPKRKQIREGWAAFATKSPAKIVSVRALRAA